MVEYEVNAINKPNRESRHEHITHIGNNTNGWKMALKTAIDRIERKVDPDAFYTVDKTTGKKVYIGVVREAGKAPFLRTHADGKWNDNLLALPECSSACKLIS